MEADIATIYSEVIAVHEDKNPAHDNAMQSVDVLPPPSSGTTDEAMEDSR